MTLPDSGEREVFSTGSVRDTTKGKPNPLLLPWEPLVLFDEVRVLANILSTRDGDLGELEDAAVDALEYLKQNPELWWRVTVRFHDGAEKYAVDNWQKGQNLTRLVESFGRHYLQWVAGLTDEDHLGAAGWNLVVLLWTSARIRNGDLPLELDDWSDRPQVQDGDFSPFVGQLDIKVESNDCFNSPIGVSAKWSSDDTPNWPHEDEAGRVMPPAEQVIDESKMGTGCGQEGCAT